MSRSLLRSLAVVVFAGSVSLLGQHKPAAKPTAKLGPGEYAVFSTSKGEFTAQLFPKEAPKSVANFVELAEGKHPYKNAATGGLSMAPFYNGLLFFRTIPNYLIQTGDQENNGQGSTGYIIPVEKNNLKFNVAGRMALAQAQGDPTSRGAQIFFTLKPVPALDAGGYLIIGQIVRGLDVAAALSQGPRKNGAQDIPQFPQILNSVKIETLH